MVSDMRHLYAISLGRDSLSKYYLSLGSFYVLSLYFGNMLARRGLVLVVLSCLCHAGKFKYLTIQYQIDLTLSYYFTISYCFIYFNFILFNPIFQFQKIKRFLWNYFILKKAEPLHILLYLPAYFKIILHML